MERGLPFQGASASGAEDDEGGFETVDLEGYEIMVGGWSSYRIEERGGGTYRFGDHVFGAFAVNDLDGDADLQLRFTQELDARLRDAFDGMEAFMLGLG